MAASALSRLLERQAVELSQLTDREVAAVLRALEDGRRELAERLRSLPASNGYSTYQLRVALLTTEEGIKQIRARMGVILDEAVSRAQQRAAEDLVAVLEQAEPDFRGAAPGLEVPVLQRLAAEQGLLLHRHSLDRYSAEMLTRLQASLVQSRVQRMTWNQAIDRIMAREGGVLAGGRARAELIVRMEHMRTYDAAHQADLERAAELLDEPDDDDPLLARADEYADNRNHPLSRALDGRTRPVRGVWRVPVAEVQAWAKKLKRPLSGILWQRQGDAYVGSTYPAHYNDRGRQTPWRASWADRS